MGTNELDLDLNEAIATGELLEFNPQTGEKYVIPLPADFVEAFNTGEALRDAAQQQLITNDAQNVTLNSIRDAKVLDRILGGASKRVVARELGISEASVEKICYAPANRQHLADCVNAMNTKMANDMVILVEQATSQLSDMLTTGDYQKRLATIDKVIGLWVKLNSIATHNQPKVTQSEIVSNTGKKTTKRSITARA